jgi:hypothetical protein
MPAALRWSLAIVGWTLLISTDAFFRGVAKATGGESAIGAGLRGVAVVLLGYLIWKWVKLSGKAPSPNQVSTTSVDEKPATRLAGVPANISVTASATQPRAVPGQTDDATDTGALVPPARPIGPSKSPQTTTGEIPSMEDTEDRIYAQVGEEIESGNTDKGIWTRAFSQAGGDDKQTRVLYIQSRVAKLLAAESEQSEALLAEQQAAVNEQERLKRVLLQVRMGAIGGACPHCYSQIDSIGVTLCPKCYRTIPST